MITDGQVRKLRRFLSRGESLSVAARRSGMTERTARKYRDSQGLPSEGRCPRHWRTRKDPFTEVWAEVQAHLEAEPKLRAFTLFGWLQEKYPGRFSDSQRRTFERRVRTWRGVQGANREVIFPQVHWPGDVGASDFTDMSSLKITIARQSFPHMLYHFVLTYSNWESATICYSESFEALSRGLQEAFWKMGGVPQRHRSDSLSAAVNNLSEDREFRARYRDLMDYYRVEPQRTNVDKPQENGDIESSNGHVKTVIDQALLLRGSRDFASYGDYEQFLLQLMDKRNVSRFEKFAEEQLHLAELPPAKLDHRHHVRDIRVSRSCTIHVKRNAYSVPSRLIGHKVNVIIDTDFVEVWYAGSQVQRMPRLMGRGKHAINYRHVIDSLVRKPGAFENYRYHADMFPTSYFRMAYDWLCGKHSPRVAAREYLKILQMAARDSEDAVQDALRLALAENEPISSKSVRQFVEQRQQAPPVTAVPVEAPNLKDYDSLLHTEMEVSTNDCASDPIRQLQDQADKTKPTFGHQAECQAGSSDESRVDGALSGTSPAHVSRTFYDRGTAGDPGVTEPPGVSPGTDGTGMSDTTGGTHHASHATFSTPAFEEVGQFRLDSFAPSDCPADGEPPRWYVSGATREPAVVWETGFGENSLSLCVR